MAEWCIEDGDEKDDESAACAAADTLPRGLRRCRVKTEQYDVYDRLQISEERIYNAEGGFEQIVCDENGQELERRLYDANGYPVSE